MKINKCEYCGKEFRSERKKKYCSNECNQKHWYEKNYKPRGLRTIECLYCKKSFLGSGGQKYCSEECKEVSSKQNQTHWYENNYKPRELKEHSCLNCKTKFKGRPTMKYCSDECRNEHYKKERTDKSKVKECLHCGSKFKGYEAHNFCCDTCRIDYYNSKNKVNNNSNCLECGNELEKGQEKYCSDLCRNRANNRVARIKRRNLIQNGKTDMDISSNKLIKRDKNVCHICGRKCDSNDYIIDNDGNFIVGKNYPSIDHVKPISKGGTHTWDNVKLAHHYCNTIKSNNEVYEGREGQLKMSI